MNVKFSPIRSSLVDYTRRSLATKASSSDRITNLSPPAALPTAILSISNTASSTTASSNITSSTPTIQQQQTLRCTTDEIKQPFATDGVDLLSSSASTLATNAGATTSATLLIRNPTYATYGGDLLSTLASTLATNAGDTTSTLTTGDCDYSSSSATESSSTTTTALDRITNSSHSAALPAAILSITNTTSSNTTDTTKDTPVLSLA